MWISPSTSSGSFVLTETVVAEIRWNILLVFRKPLFDFVYDRVYMLGGVRVVIEEPDEHHQRLEVAAQLLLSVQKLASLHMAVMQRPRSGAVILHQHIKRNSRLGTFW